MVQQNVETVEIMDDEEVQQLGAETTQQPDDEMPETLEEQAQQVAIEQRYFDARVAAAYRAASSSWCWSNSASRPRHFSENSFCRTRPEYGAGQTVRRAKMLRIVRSPVPITMRPCPCR